MYIHTLKYPYTRAHMYRNHFFFCGIEPSAAAAILYLRICIHTLQCIYIYFQNAYTHVHTYIGTSIFCGFNRLPPRPSSIIYVHMYIHTLKYPYTRAHMHRNQYFLWYPTVCRRGYSICTLSCTYIKIHILLRYIYTCAHIYRNQYFLWFPTVCRRGHSASNRT